jgi:hypothetical protein
VIFTSEGDADLPFDIFAASFFLVARYEEYYDFTPDQFGRFPAASSAAFKNGFLHIPVVNLWAMEFARALLLKFRSIAFRKNEYRSLLTVDIDEPFAFLGKNILYSVGGLLRDLGTDVGLAAGRYRSVVHGNKDPYEIYDYIIENIERSGSPARFFIPVGDRSEYDRNPSWKNADYRRLISRLVQKYDPGLHPSFHVTDNPGLLTTEADRLHKVLGRRVTASRFHFIKFRLPGSYRSLISNGITEDYSMGYPEEPGFRAGMANSFFFYDISEEKKTSLRIFPFQVMDGTLFKYKGYNADESKNVIRKLIHETKKAGGLFISIWHNTSLLADPKCSYKREVFEYLIKQQMS